MTQTLSRLSLVALFALTACGSNNVSTPTGTSTLAGKVLFADGSDAAGLSVSMTGIVSRAATTGAGGAYSFDKLPDGTYLVAIEGTNTKEGRFTAAVEVKGAATVPDQTFHALGTVTGVVSDSAGPVAGAVVEVAGTTLSAVTDDKGAFTFDAVPAGDARLTAHEAAHVVQQYSGSAQVKVKRGANEPAAITVSTVALPTGKISGAVQLYSNDAPKGVKVSVSATLSATTDDKGLFTLDAVPPGFYAVKAELDGYPAQVLASVEVKGGQTVVLPTHFLSFYVRVPFETQIDNLSLPSGGVGNGGDWVVVNLSGPQGDDQTWALNRVTLERRLLGIGIDGSVYLSKTGKYATFGINNEGPESQVVVEIATGKAVVFHSGRSLNFGSFSSDEKAIFLTTNSQEAVQAQFLTRGDPATGAFKEIAGTGYKLSDDEYVVGDDSMSSTFDVKLVTSTTEAVVFSQVNSFDAYQKGVLNGGYAYARKCTTAGNTTSCTYQVLQPGKTAAVTVTGTFDSSFYFGSQSYDGQWLAYSWGSSPAKAGLVKLADGSVTPLPDNTEVSSTLAFSYDASRVLYRTRVGTAVQQIEVRESAVPLPAAVPAPVVTLGISDTFNSSWVSNTRLVGFHVSGSTTKRYDIKNGAVSTDTDVESSSAVTTFNGAAWRRNSTGKLVALVGDGTVVALDNIFGPASTDLRVVGGVTSLSPLVFSKSMVIGDGVRVAVLDGVKGEARFVTYGEVAADEIAIFSKETYSYRQVNGSFLRRYDTDRAVLLNEPGTYPEDFTLTNLTGTGLVVVARADVDTSFAVLLGSFR